MASVGVTVEAKTASSALPSDDSSSSRIPSTQRAPSDEGPTLFASNLMTPRVASVHPMDHNAFNQGGISDATRDKLSDLVNRLRYRGSNPFIPRTRVGCYEILKVLFMLLSGIALIRIVLVILIVLLMYTLCSLGTCCHDPKQPFSWWRRALTYPTRFLSRVILFIVGFYWVPVTDRRKKKNAKAQIFTPNHISIWDPFYLHYYCGVSPAAKADLFDLPIIGTLLKGAWQGLPVNRASAKGRIESIKLIESRAGDPRFPHLCVFPEGTTHNDRTMIMFKRGVFVPGKTVVPVVLEYPNYFNDLYFGTKSLAYYFFMSCCQFINFHRVSFLEEYAPSEAEKKSYTKFARNVRAKMVEYLQSKNQKIETTDHSYADVKLFSMANKKFASQEVVVEKSLQLFHMSLGEFDELVNQFLNKDSNHNGMIDFDEFMDLVGLKRQDPHDVEVGGDFFSLLDTDKNGKLDFVEFIAAFGALSSHKEVQDGLPQLLDQILVKVKRDADTAPDEYEEREEREDAAEHV